jgi:alkanesulfonate monooxygenase SsuD/methylene tetrahydromethanopterin reductase-like flavin-dependent oxidoreductase (luciferase family)
MRYALYTPNFGYFGEAATLAEFAAEAEAFGWDGFFIWDHLQWPQMEPAVDPWIALTAMAMRTKRIVLGPMITPLPRRDLAKLARETVSLDRLSGGRLILGLGLGWIHNPEWSGFGHETDLKIRGEMLDEGLSVLEALWSGEPVDHRGKYYKVVCDGFAQAAQKPRIPIWLAGGWPSVKPFRRAAKWDGVMPMAKNAAEGGDLSPSEITDLKRFIRDQWDEDKPYEIVFDGTTENANDTSVVAEYAAAGATWWLEARDPWDMSKDELMARIRSGPPRVSG